MSPFKFKQFTIHQDRCAMKIGTDGVLLGAWTPLEGDPKSILDVGAGTGLIALMMAQRSEAEIIDAIEIDGDAYEQCVENFEASPWPDRLFCYHTGFNEFVDEVDEKYDLIVSNPPFFSEDVSSGDVSRDTSRQNKFLPFVELLKGVSKLLSEEGTFATIVPYQKEKEFVEMAKSFNLHTNRLLRVRGNASSKLKRSLLEFGFKKIGLGKDELTIEISRHKYTKDYIELTKDFYPGC